VGTVFQVVGVVLFITSMFICCASSLVSKDVATQTSLNNIGWSHYSAQLAVTVSLVASVFVGIALATLGLGLQAQNRRAPTLALMTVAFGVAFWLLQVVFFITVHLLLMLAISAVLCLLFVPMLILAIGAWREMRRNPTPVGFEILPSDYKVPYSHLHQDPPEVRLERELQSRKERLAVQQKELQLLEEKLRRKMKEKES
jgi:lysylphosphatidylglycerol synthetase-like protein (DUF2156 family)